MTKFKVKRSKRTKQWTAQLLVDGKVIMSTGRQCYTRQIDAIRAVDIAKMTDAHTPVEVIR